MLRDSVVQAANKNLSEKKKQVQKTSKYIEYVKFWMKRKLSTDRGKYMIDVKTLQLMKGKLSIKKKYIKFDFILSTMYL